jgi:hypothetical protein
VLNGSAPARAFPRRARPGQWGAGMLRALRRRLAEARHRHRGWWSQVVMTRPD